MADKKKTPFEGAYVLAVLNATQAAIEMAYKMEECQTGRAVRCSGFSVLLDSEVADKHLFLHGDTEYEPSDGKFVIVDNREEQGRDYPVILWDEKRNKPLVATTDFAEALEHIGLQLLRKTDEKESRRSLCVARAARLLMLADLWTEGEDAWARSGLENQAWVRHLGSWDDSIAALMKHDGKRGEDEEDEKMPF